MTVATGLLCCVQAGGEGGAGAAGGTGPTGLARERCPAPPAAAVPPAHCC